MRDQLFEQSWRYISGCRRILYSSLKKRHRLGLVNIEVRRTEPAFLPTEDGKYDICDTDVCVMVPGWEVEIIKLF